MVGKKKISRAKVKELHSQGLFDREIAEELGCSKRSINYIRKELNLPSNRGWGPGKKKDISMDELRALHEKGLSDAKIAQKMGICRDTVGNRRRELGLETNFKTKVSREKVKELYKQGLNDKEIAEELGVHYGTIWNIRKVELDLEPNSSSIDCDKFWDDYYNKGKTLEELKEKYDIKSPYLLIGRLGKERLDIFDGPRKKEE